MKGYITRNGKVTLVDKKGRAFGTIELSNGESAEIDLPIEQAKKIHLKDVSELLSAFDFAVSAYSCSMWNPVKVGPLAFWYTQNRWILGVVNEAPLNVYLELH